MNEKLKPFDVSELPESMATNWFASLSSVLETEEPQSGISKEEISAGEIDNSERSSLVGETLNDETDTREEIRIAARQRRRHTPQSKMFESIICRRPSQRRSELGLEHVMSYQRRILYEAVSTDFSGGNSLQLRHWAKKQQRRLYPEAIKAAVSLVRVDTSNAGELSLGHLDPETKRHVMNLWKRVKDVPRYVQLPDYIRLKRIIAINQDLSDLEVITELSSQSFRDAYLRLLGSRLLNPNQTIFPILTDGNGDKTRRFLAFFMPANEPLSFQYDEFSIPHHDDITRKLQEFYLQIIDSVNEKRWDYLVNRIEDKKLAERILRSHKWEIEIAQVSCDRNKAVSLKLIVQFNPEGLLRISSNTLLTNLLAGDGVSIKELYKKGILQLKFISEGLSPKKLSDAEDALNQILAN